MIQRTGFLATVLTAAAYFVVVSLSACSDDEASGDCFSDEDCFGYACDRQAGAASGVCLSQCATSGDCATGFVCDENSLCVAAPDGAPCLDDSDCADGGFACDITPEQQVGTCPTACTGDQDCADDFVCTAEGACVDSSATCSSDSECGGFLCVVADGEISGTCTTSCTSNAECATPFICGTTGLCSAPDCASDGECGGVYACNRVTGTCFDFCTDGRECAEDAQCVDGACETVGGEAYSLVAVVSEIPIGSDSAQSSTPGPDIDAIEYRRTSTGNSFFAGNVVASSRSGGEADDPQAALGVADSVATRPGDECDLLSGYWSMGDNSGFGVFTIGGVPEFAEGDFLTVYEVASDRCPGLAFQEDAYSVWVGTDVNVFDAAGVRSSYCSVGGSGAEGGVFEGTVPASPCPE